MELSLTVPWDIKLKSSRSHEKKALQFLGFFKPQKENKLIKKALVVILSSNSGERKASLTLFRFGSFGVLHASHQEVTALARVLLGKITEVTDVGTGGEVAAVHGDALLFHGLCEKLDVPVPDHLVRSGVQQVVGPGGRPLSHGVVVVLVDELRHRVQHDPQEEDAHREKRQEDVL